MKRSEVVELLEKSFFKHMNNVDHDTDKEVYSAVLEDLEKVMLPNTICYNAVGEYGKIEDTDILHDNDVSFSWEPEDE